jgi:hypothetical protein
VTLPCRSNNALFPLIAIVALSSSILILCGVVAGIGTLMQWRARLKRSRGATPMRRASPRRLDHDAGLERAARPPDRVHPRVSVPAVLRLPLTARVLHIGVIGARMCSRATARAGGVVVGILPGFSRRDANRSVTIPIVTGMDQARNVVLVRSCDVVIAVDESYGTLSEIALALMLGVPVIGLRARKLAQPEGRRVPLRQARTPDAAGAVPGHLEESLSLGAHWRHYCRRRRSTSSIRACRSATRSFSSVTVRSSCSRRACSSVN